MAAGARASTRTVPTKPGGGSRNGGFTLIEVLVAAMILAIGMVGVSSMVSYGVLSHQKSARYTIAAERANQEIERIRDSGYLAAVVDALHFPSPYQIVNSTTVSFDVAELPGGHGTIVIADDPHALSVNPSTGAPYSNLKQVSVFVTWSGSPRVAGSYGVATLITNRP